MHHIVFDIEEKKRYEDAKKEAKKSKYLSVFIQVFTGITEEKKIKKILRKLCKDFPSATIVGTTTAGEIADAKMYDSSTIVSLSLFEKTKLSVAYTPNIEKKSAKKLAKQLAKKRTKALLVLSEGLKGEDYEGFVTTLHNELPEIVIAGGLAGDNFALKETFVFLDDKVYEPQKTDPNLSMCIIHIQ